MTTDTAHGVPGTAGSRPFLVLCVCEGNICRSPVAAFLLQAALGPHVQVTSAGTRAVVGAPVAPPMAVLLRDRGVASEAFRARQLQPVLLQEADLVLALTRQQRGRAVELFPGVVRRSFTLRELARLLADVDPGALPPGPVAERLRRAIPAAAAQRRYVADARGDDIADPYGLDEPAYRRAFSEIADAVDRVSAAIVPAAVV